MTIAVYDGKTIAADRQLTTNSVISGYVKKIQPWSGGIFVYTGTETDGPKFQRLLEKGVLPKVSKHFAGLFTREGRVWLINEHLEPWPASTPAAIGSSWEAAEMLVRSGLTAKEAVQIICRYDVHCGGKVDTVAV